MNKQNVGNFLLPLVATRQVRQGGYLHKNIFDVQHLHQSKGRKYFVKYLKMISKIGEKPIQVVKLCTENRIHDMMNKNTTKNLKRTQIYIKLQNTIIIIKPYQFIQMAKVAPSHNY